MLAVLNVVDLLKYRHMTYDAVSWGGAQDHHPQFRNERTKLKRRYGIYLLHSDHTFAASPPPYPTSEMSAIDYL